MEKDKVIAPFDVILEYDKRFGFMLKSHDEKGRRVVDSNAFVVSSKQTIPASFSTGAVGYANITPEKIAPLVVVDDWREGFGAEDYDNRYHDAEETDGRFKGRILLGPKQLAAVDYPASAETTVPYPPVTLWTISDSGTMTATASDDGVGFNCGNGAGSGSVQYDMPWDDSLQGKTVKVSWSGTEAAGATLTCQVLDGVDTTTTSANTGTASYTTTHTFNAAATQFRIRFSGSGDEIPEDSSVDDIAMVRTDTPYGATGFVINYGSSLVVASGSTLLSSSDGASFTVKVDFLAPITALCVFDSTLFIALGTSNTFYYTTDLANFTASTSYTAGSGDSTTTTADHTSAETAIAVADSSVFDTNDYVRWENEVCQVDGKPDAHTLTLDRAELGSAAVAHASGTTIYELSSTGGAKYMANVSDTQFWVSTGDNTLCDSDNPINNGTPFSTAYELPNSSYDITCLMNDPEGYVYVGKQDMPYVLSGADVLTLAPELSSESSTAGVLLFKFKDDVFIRTGTNKLYRYGDSIEDISPVNWAFGNPDYDEEIQAFCNDSQYLYVFQDNGTDINLLAGRDEIVGGSAMWVWHPLAKFASNDIVSCVVSSVSGYPVIYALTSDASDGVLKFACPQSYGDTNIETGYKYASSGDHYTPWFVTEFNQHDKYWSELFMSARNFDGVTTIRTYYQLEGEDKTSTWHDMGLADADTGVISGKVTTSAKVQVSKFVIDATSRKIRFKFSLSTSDDDVSPVILSYVVYGRVENSIGDITTDKKDISLLIACHGEDLQRSGSLMNRTVRGELKTLLDLKAAKKALTFYGLDGIKRKVMFKSEDFGYQPDGENTFVVACRLEEI
jgi:hypothetical protein